MKSRWSDHDAQAFIERYAEQGINEDIALRTYTTRLLGSDPKLVLHGGGNTSVKTTVKDMLGDAVEVLCVKGSGWDMGAIEPAGLPAVRLAPLRRLRASDTLSDEDMVAFQRINLLDPSSPNPSVETLLHAFLPHKFVDHTHSTAVLALTDQPDGEALLRELYGERVATVPYVMPGFALAKAVADIFDKNPKVEGLLLVRHGFFTMGATAREAYERMIEFVTLAEERLQKNRKPLTQATLPAKLASVAEIAPILRGAVTISRDETAGTVKRQVLDFRSSDAILNYVNGADLARYSQIGVVTPDHTIRTKNWPLIVPAPEAGKLDAWKSAVKEAVTAYVARYHDYFARNNAKSAQKKIELDPLPRVVLVPGVGLFGLGASSKDAAIAADIAENTVEVITDAEAVGSFRPIDEFDLFEMEYWSLEQAKLGKASEKPLARQVAVITGGGSGIGAATAKAFAKEGCEIAILDRDHEAAVAAAKAVHKNALAIAVRRDGCGLGARRLRQGGGGLRRGRYRRLQCRRGVAGAHRRCRRCRAAQIVRAQFLRPSIGGAGRRACDARAGHGRLPLVQHLQAGDQSGQGFRALRSAQGLDAVPDEAICARSRKRRHSLQRCQCRSHPLRPSDRRDGGLTLQGAWLKRNRLHERQSARPRSDGRRCRRRLRLSRQGDENHRRHPHRRWREHRGEFALNAFRHGRA